MKEIIYSKLDVEKVTLTMDRLLDFRDEYLFATLFEGCRKGYVAGAEYKKRKLRKKPILNAVLWIFVAWCIIFGLRMRNGLMEPQQAIHDAVWIAIICILLYWIFLSVRSICFLGRSWYAHSHGIYNHDLIPEERLDHRDHLMIKPVFCGASVIRAKRRIRQARKDKQREEEQQLAGKLYECAYDLFVVRQMIRISEEIRQMEDRYGIDFVDFQLMVDNNKRTWEWDDVYKIMITAKIPEAEDTVIPTEKAEETKVFELPYEAGMAVEREYGKNKRLDLSVLDGVYYNEIKNNLGMYKRAIKNRMRTMNQEDRPKVTTAMEKVKF